MNLRSRLTAAWSALTAKGMTSSDYFGPTGGPGTSDAFLSRRAPSPYRLVESFRNLVYACACLNSAGVARTPLRLYAITRKGGQRARAFAGPVPVPARRAKHLRGLGYVARDMQAAEAVEEITSHPLLDLLDEPNSEFDRPLLLAYLSLSIDVVGSGYVRTDDGTPGLPPQHLWPLQPQHVYPERITGSAIPDAYIYFGERLTHEQLVRFKMVSLRDPYGPGYAPAQAAYSYGGLEELWVTSQEQLLRIGPRPSAIVGPIDPAQPFSPDQAKRLRADLNRKHAQAAGGGVIVSEGGYTFNALTYKPSEMGGTDLPRYVLERICNCFDVPVAFFTSETNLANLQAAETQHGKHGIEPRCVRIASALTRWAKRFDDRLFFAFDPAVGEDEERESRTDDRDIKNGSLTINERRTKRGLAEVPWGDEPWFSNTVTQPSELEEQRQQAQAQAEQATMTPADEGPGEEPPEPPAEESPAGAQDDDDEKPEKALHPEIAATLRMVRDELARRSAPEDYDDDGDGDDRDDDPAHPDDGPDGPGAATPEQGPPGGEHVQPSAGGTGPADAETVVSDAGEGDHRDAGHAGGGAAD